MCLFVVLCPPGTHHRDRDCPLCEADTYNDKYGQAACISCPASSTSPAGSDSAAKCISTCTSVPLSILTSDVREVPSSHHCIVIVRPADVSRRPYLLLGCLVFLPEL